ncbi:MAG: hypothetical protein V5786_01960 [Psychromonas sp.]
MPLSHSSLESKLLTEFKNNGIITEGEFARSKDLAKAIASAVIDELTENGLVEVTGGSSAGSYKIT